MNVVMSTDWQRTSSPSVSHAEPTTDEARHCSFCFDFLEMSVSLSHGFTRLWCAKTAERIEVLFGAKTLVSPRNIVLDEGPYPLRRTV